ncbi:hypothetical protein Srot_0030 [Segniliparus rotundus DSM 44985]|uniref:Uncharacterized protein n=1 Tax=Segniliparus rotundus (strain ATCC BAA-972 / CDC 1076 / CIP 108378 / DSM 44985 / JCM 13578) TaxID=640132 RepID=D6Z9J6_SEGRD|nr:hypothetical protein [Segniliparus rotundus]ADG96523.1 hypothetical protein Srot_0030 [Segniliparus rotundus DSM 44985]
MSRRRAKKSVWSTAHWSQRDRDEHDALVYEAWESSKRQDERTDFYLNGLIDAEQAQRGWAVEVLAHYRRNGCANGLKNHMKRCRVPMSHDGRILSKPAVVGARRTDEDGTRYYEQALIYYVTLPELREKQKESIALSKTYDETTAMFGKLIALCEAGGANTPAEAAENLGVTVEGWLLGAAA